MNIEKKEHKLILWELFFEERDTMQGKKVMPKDFPLEDLAAAGFAKKRLKFELLDKEKETYGWLDGVLEFPPDEVVVLKKLFDEKKKWSVDASETVAELKAIFSPPKEPKATA